MCRLPSKPAGNPRWLSTTYPSSKENDQPPRTSWRVVSLVPQLAGILGAYVFGPRLERPGHLLFPSFATGQEAMSVDVRKVIDRVAMRAG